MCSIYEAVSLSEILPRGKYGTSSATFLHVYHLSRAHTCICYLALGDVVTDLVGTRGQGTDGGVRQQRITSLPTNTRAASCDFLAIERRRATLRDGMP